MDYQQLYMLIPKLHAQWTIEDTKTWLTFIGLENLQRKFQTSSIDGSILSDLSESDFKFELEITSKIIVKKLLHWITIGLHEFDKHILSKSKINTNEQEFSKSSLNYYKKQSRFKARQISLTQQPKRHQTNELIIRQLQQSQINNYSIKERNAIIGRQASNQIVILDEFVSRQHAQIIYDKHQYYIRDLGSSSGTFIKIHQKMKLLQKMIIEMGSNQFEINYYEDGLILKVIEGPNQQAIYPLINSEIFSIGRKESNEMSFPDDEHLSGIHSKIFKIRGQWFIQDIATTNGTWIRLSNQEVESQPYLLQDKCQFKLSSNLIYECKLNNNNRRTFKSNQQKCLLCKIEDKNTIIMPCKHAVGCFTCLKDQIQCPICQTTIKQLVKMFTS